MRRHHALVVLLLCFLPSAPAQNAAPQAAPLKSSSAGSSKPGQSQNQSQAAQWPESQDQRAWTYSQKAFARVIGNFGGWWSFLTEPEKAAFLDGYQQAMRLSLTTNGVLCEIFQKRLSPSSDAQAFNNQVAMAVVVCQQSGEFSGFEKVTVKDLDEFYSDPVNQPILLDFSMAYLRDKATGRKTEGQLLDALKAEQRNIHDCSKYPGLCKLGVPSSPAR
jgi:hypothetical protein